MSPTKQQLDEDIQFLRKRANRAGSCTFGGEGRSWGISSNAIINFAYGGPWPRKSQMPWDQSDLNACERAVKRLPEHRRTPKVMKALQNARDALKRRDKREEQRRNERLARGIMSDDGLDVAAKYSPDGLEGEME